MSKSYHYSDMMRIQDLPQWAALVAEYEKTSNIVGASNSVMAKVGELLLALAVKP